MKAEDLAKKYKGSGRPNNEGFCHFKCPAHDDSAASAWAKNGTQGKDIVVGCYVCGEQALEKYLKDIGDLPKKQAKEKTKGPYPFNEAKQTEYVYQNADGTPRYIKVRYDHKEHGKRFTFMTPERKKGIGDITKCLYRLPKLLEARQNDEIIFLVEGEKCADRLTELGLIATTHSTGAAGKWEKHYTETLENAKVIIVPDADIPGKKFGEKVHAHLRRCATARILYLKEIQGKEDVYDWLEDGHTAKELVELAEALLNEPENDLDFTPLSSFPPGVLLDTDFANAFRLMHKYGDYIRAVPQNEQGFFVWNGTKWAADKAAAHKMAQEVAIDINNYEAPLAEGQSRLALEKWAKRSQSQAKVNSMLEVAGHHLHKPIEEFDALPNMFNCANGVIDLDTGTLIPHNQAREQYHTQQSPVEFKPEADCPYFMEFLNSAFDNDVDTIKSLQEWAGYVLSGYNDQELLVYFYGEPQRGKSTFAGALYHILGDYATTMRSRAWTKTRFKQTEDSIIALLGKRFCWIDETNKGDKLDESQFKTVVSGEPIRGKYLYANSIAFEPYTKLLIHGNYRLECSPDNSVFRRLWTIEFNQPVKEIKDYKKLFKGEMSGILNWMAKGYLRYRQNKKLTPSPAIERWNKEYQESQDVLEHFIDTHCETGIGKKVKVSQLWEAFQNWLDKDKKYEWTRRGFSQEMQKRGFVAKKKTGGLYFFEGICEGESDEQEAPRYDNQRSKYSAPF